MESKRGRPPWCVGPFWKCDRISLIVTLWFLGWGAQELLEKWPPFVRLQHAAYDDVVSTFGASEAKHTVVVGITAQDVQSVFDTTRPVPPDSLLAAVRALRRMQPRTLVVDVFTDDTSYRRLASSEQWDGIVWAQAPDTSTATGELAEVLGGAGQAGPSLRSGVAVLVADEDDVLRRVRTRYRGGLSLPMAAVQSDSACSNDVCRSKDTVSYAPLRRYTRSPPFYALSDVLSASRSEGITPLYQRIVVLGFVDESDRTQTPEGSRPGPYVVADAIETLLDSRAIIHNLWMPVDLTLSLCLNMLAAVLVWRLTKMWARGRPKLSHAMGKDFEEFEDFKERVEVGVRLLFVLLSIAATYVLFKGWGIWMSIVGSAVGALLEPQIAPFAKPVIDRLHHRIAPWWRRRRAPPAGRPNAASGTAAEVHKA